MNKLRFGFLRCQVYLECCGIFAQEVITKIRRKEWRNKTGSQWEADGRSGNPDLFLGLPSFV